ncbi:hypothetical protein ADK60_14490 [Streptomyces sp. XY431]|nr:hypothetical protein VR45_11720 [Streptomyces sp. NRRL S-495]KOV31836.1 hypothetical protein ADK60_14490 [Streptomyces sp. XY431]BEK64923.1 hypothetical protein KPHV_21500 [Kitasatospora purpeofusca]
MTPPKLVRQPEYEYQSLRMPRGTSRNAARQLLTDHAEYGHWELDRLRLLPDGSRTVLLRRRIIRQVRSW